MDLCREMYSQTTYYCRHLVYRQIVKQMMELYSIYSMYTVCIAMYVKNLPIQAGSLPNCKVSNLLLYQSPILNLILKFVSYFGFS